MTGNGSNGPMMKQDNSWSSQQYKHMTDSKLQIKNYTREAREFDVCFLETFYSFSLFCFT